MRIKKNINLRIISRSNAKFSECNCKNCIVDSKEKDKFDLGVKGLKFVTFLWPALYYFALR